MKGQAYINDKDIWETWRMILWKGTYEALLTPVPAKEVISNETSLSNGQIVSIPSTGIVQDKREVSFSVFIDGLSVDDYLARLKSFTEELNKGTLTLKVPRLGAVYRFVYKDCQKYGDFGVKRGKFTLRFIEPNPANRGDTDITNA